MFFQQRDNNRNENWYGKYKLSKLYVYTVLEMLSAFVDNIPSGLTISSLDIVRKP